MSEASEDQATEPQAPRASVGQWLRERRESLELSSDAVATALHLDRHIIDALESEDFAALGATVFAKGHLRAVAHYLKLDLDEANERFHASAGIAPDELPALIVQYNKPMRRPTSIKPALLGVFGLLAIAAIAFVLWARLGESTGAVDDGASAPATQPAQQMTNDDVPSEPAGGSTQFSELLNAARDGVDDAQTIPVDEPAVTDTANATAGEPEERGLRLTFSDACWFEVRDAAGTRIAYGTAQSGTDRLVTGQRPFSVTLGVADAAQLRLDGEPVSIDPASRRGRSARLTIP